MNHVLDRLFAIVAGRRGADPKASYTAKLFADGRSKICQKLGEEAVETVIAGTAGTSAQVASESADLLYHLLVLWADAGVGPQDVWAILEKREGTSGLAEKAARKETP
ncbi:MAG: phosphoribosyl-ATP diphosphatase [Magnetospirillum sp. WYHS-4]